jgi:hypothetical protein
MRLISPRVAFIYEVINLLKLKTCEVPHFLLPFLYLILTYKFSILNTLNLRELPTRKMISKYKNNIPMSVLSLS